MKSIVEELEELEQFEKQAKKRVFEDVENVMKRQQQRRDTLKTYVNEIEKHFGKPKIWHKFECFYEQIDI